MIPYGSAATRTCAICTDAQTTRWCIAVGFLSRVPTMPKGQSQRVKGISARQRAKGDPLPEGWWHLDQRLAWDVTTIKAWWQLSEESSGADTPGSPEDAHGVTTAPDTTPGLEDSPETPKAWDMTIKAWWQLSQESSEADTPSGPEGAHGTATAPDTTIRTWWELSEESSAVATPRGHEDGAVGHSRSRIRTPSPEDRYVWHDVSVAGASQHYMLPLTMQQWHTPYAEAPAVLAMAVPPPPQPPWLLVPCGPAGVPCQAPADAYAHSIGSVGHPHSCAPPCKYSRGGRVCKDGASCSRCHICSWKRSVK
jgi:hypothetical protein